MSLKPRQRVIEAFNEEYPEKGYVQKASSVWQEIKENPELQISGEFFASPARRVVESNDLLLISILFKKLLKEGEDKVNDLQKRLAYLEHELIKTVENINFNDEKQLDALIADSAALTKFCQKRKMTLASKKLLIKNKDKFERLYKKRGLKSSLQNYFGVLKVKDAESARELLE